MSKEDLKSQQFLAPEHVGCFEIPEDVGVIVGDFLERHREWKNTHPDFVGRITWSDKEEFVSSMAHELMESIERKGRGQVRPRAVFLIGSGVSGDLGVKSKEGENVVDLDFLMLFDLVGYDDFGVILYVENELAERHIMHDGCWVVVDVTFAEMTNMKKRRRGNIEPGVPWQLQPHELMHNYDLTFREYQDLIFWAVDHVGSYGHEIIDQMNSKFTRPGMIE